MEVVGDTAEDTQHISEKGVLPKTPAAADTTRAVAEELIRDGNFAWTAEARMRLNRVPEGFMRNITQGRIEECAAAKGAEVITLALAEEGIAIGRQLMQEMIKDYKKDGHESKT
jgi:hypothetical protein